MGPSRDQLPDWLMVGTPKSGTTSVASWLGSHPQVFVSTPKELSFYDAHWDRGLNWYAEQFAARTPGQVAGEATPVYAYSLDVLDRIHETLPGVKLLLLLREPAERMWSQAWFLRNMGVDPRGLARATAVERKHPDRLGFNLPVGHLATSRYAKAVRDIRERFGSESLHVEFYDDISKRPLEVWQRICRHIGVDPDLATPDVARRLNPGGSPRSSWLQYAMFCVAQSGIERKLPRIREARRRVIRWNASSWPYPPMPAELRARLRAEFASEMRELPELLGRPLPPGWLD